MLSRLKKTLFLSILSTLLLINNAFAVTTFETTWCTSGCDYTAASTATAALDNAGDIRSASNLAKTGSWDNQSGSNIADNAAITWDSGARSGTLIHMTATQYLIKCATTTDCTNLGDNDTVSDGTNTFDINGAPDSPIIRIACNENATFTDNFTVSMGSATNSNSTNYMIVSVNPSYRHNGTTSSTGCKVQTTANAFTATLGSHSSTVEWLRLGESVNSASNLGCLTYSSTFGNWNLGARNLVIENCNSSGGGSWNGVVMDHSANTGNPVNYINNSIIYNSENNGITLNTSTGKDLTIENVTIYGSGNLGISAGGSGLQVVRNVLSCSNTGGDYGGSYDTFTTSGSCDSSGTSGLTSLSSATEFNNTASNDYHLKSGATSINAGTDLGTTLSVQFDIDNYDRDTSGVVWDLGADELVATAASTAAASISGFKFSGITASGM